ncbi:MAG: hypothetical protein MUF57_04420 [Gammaproteobacteria bacterium]|nr:hypothetical protein [Gammaproteobacteria bacterium]
MKDAEHTNPPGIASTSILKAAERRSSRSMVEGSTGRSLMTVSAPPPWMRRARTTMPASFKARSGVSKKNACRGCASTGSSPMLSIVARWLARGTDSFSSTLVAPFTNPNISTTWSPVKGFARAGCSIRDTAMAFTGFARALDFGVFLPVLVIMVFSPFRSGKRKPRPVREGLRHEPQHALQAPNRSASTP